MPPVIFKCMIPRSHLRNSSFLHFSKKQDPTITSIGADCSLSAMINQSKRLRNWIMMTTRIGLRKATWRKSKANEAVGASLERALTEEVDGQMDEQPLEKKRRKA